MLKAGWRAPTTGAGLAETRSLVFFPLPDELSNKLGQQNNVLSAQLSLFNNHSYTCGATPAVQVRPNAQGWSAAGTTWNNQPGTINTVTAGTFAYGYSSACPANWARLDVQPQAQGWSAGAYTNYGVQVATATSEATGYKRFAPADAGGATAPTLRIVWENCTTITGGPAGPHKVCGAIRDTWRQLGGTGWGYPTTDEIIGNGGAHSDFAIPGQSATTRSIYWHPTVGANLVQGAIRDRYRALGADNPTGPGFPEFDEQSEAFGAASSAFYNPANSSRTDITWGSAYGAWEVRGAIRDRWRALGGIGNGTDGVGFPRTGETPIAGGGAYNDFGYPGKLDQSIHWSPGTGAHRTRGAIRQVWLDNGGQPGPLGYPLDDEQVIAGGARTEFQGGNITYEARSNSTTVGAGVLPYPTAFQKVTQKRTQLQGQVKVASHDYDNVTFQWRRYSLTPNDGWTDVPSEHLQTADGTALPAGANPLPVTRTSIPASSGTPGQTASTPAYTAEQSLKYTWNATATIADDGLVQVRARFHDTTDNTQRATAPTQVTVDRAGLTGAASTATVGPGTVSLLTGAYALTGRDADITAPFGGLALTRTFQSNNPTRPSPLGPGWVPSLAVDEGGADYAGLVDRGDTVLISREDGTQAPYVRSAPSSNTYIAEGEASTEGATLVFSTDSTGASLTPASYVLTDEDGDSVTFTRPSGAGHGTPTAPAPFRVSKVAAIRGTGSPAVTTVLYTDAGNPRALIAPTDDGTSCPDTATADSTGCRWLEFTYTDTTSSQKMTGVVLHARGAAAPTGGLVDATTPITASTVTLATYDYDSNGRLASVTDPRSALTASYAYDSSGRLTGITPPGAQNAWTLSYTPTYNAALAPVRLSTAALSDTSGNTNPLPALTSTVVYDVPLAAGNGRPDLTPAAAKAWGQTSSPPTDLTAVFDAANDPHATAASAITGPAVWQGAQLSALDVNGRTVNTAHYGGTVDKAGNTVPAAWRIDTTEYDSQNRGNTVRTLSAGNRDRALASSTDPAAQLRQARVLDTLTTYTPDGRDVLRSYGPAHPVTVRPVGGTARTSDVRSRTITSYDTGSEPGHPAGPVLHLPVSTTTDTIDAVATVPAPTATDPAATVQVTTSSDYLAGPAGDQVPGTSGVTARTTKVAYSDGTSTDNGFGWKFGIPVKTTVNPTTGTPGDPGTDQVTMSRVDAQGRTISSTLPGGNGAENTPATTLTTYYTATTPTGGDPACTQPAYAGWVCKTRPAAQPATTSSAGTPVTFGVPATWTAAYDLYGQALRTVETAPDGTVTRTRDTRYDAASRSRISTISTTGTTGSDSVQAVPETDTDYDPGTGQVTTVSTPGGTTTAGTGPITHLYDAYGRQTSYTDGTGTSTTTRYDSVGRVAGSHSDHGERTITYDQNGDRNQPTSVYDSAATSGDLFTAAYDADGTLGRQTFPGGMTATTVSDASGKPASRAYSKPNSTTSGDWVRSSSTYSELDQSDTGTDTTAPGTTGDPATTNTYTYDSTGRLTAAADTPTGSSDPTTRCSRAYGYDRNSNRTSRTSTCGSTTSTDSYAYDTADRLLPNTTSRASLRYDHLGRTRTLPSTDTADGGGDLTLGYYANDLVASQTQTTGGTTRTTSFTLDPALRRTVRNDAVTGQPTDTTISHYDDDTDNPDWTSNPNGSWTRNLSGFDGTLTATQTLTGAGATSNTSSLTLHLANLHGDILATLPATADTPSQAQVSETDEYGQARTKPTPGTLQSKYGYLGSYLRDSSTPGGLTLMGVRLYTPSLGRFLTVDPVEGGSANDYDYCDADPVGCTDLAGTWGWHNIKKFFNDHASTIGTIAAVVAIPFTGPAAIVIGAVAVGFSAYASYREFRGGHYQDAAWDGFGALAGAGAIVKGVSAIRATRATRRASRALGAMKGGRRVAQRKFRSAYHSAQRAERHAHASARRWSRASNTLSAVSGGRWLYQHRHWRS